MDKFTDAQLAWFRTGKFVETPDLANTDWRLLFSMFFREMWFSIGNTNRIERSLINPILVTERVKFLLVGYGGVLLRN